MEQNRSYCSLDIETSGFDPLTNEILEVGFAFFEIRKNGIKITEEYTQVFKPTKPVSPQILALTGISQSELDAAPAFREHQQLLQEKLGEAIIVGHNISFDTKFLEAFGIKFSGKTIDTLDLVQFLLPTHHSYNLENLMHTFGISHKEAHRALADSKATLKLLEKMLGIFSGFPPQLKKQISTLIIGAGFCWEELFSAEFKPVNASDFLGSPSGQKQLGYFDFDLGSKRVFSVANNGDCLVKVANGLSRKKKDLLLVLPKLQDVLLLLRRSAVSEAVFLPEQQFDSKKFAALMKKPNLTAEEIKFTLKILVWQKTNWQNQTILDLNLSFFGGQFKSLVTGGKFKEKKEKGLVACDHATFLELSSQGLYQDRQIIIFGLSEFESNITRGLGTKISWGYISYLLKSFYNFELSVGQENYKQPVAEALAATDLFFGLVNALLQTNPPTFQYYKITPQTQYQESYQKIKAAAANYGEKLIKANIVLKSAQVENFVRDLSKFFETEENRVKWMELAENRCALLSMPVVIAPLVEKILEPYQKACFADCLSTDSLFKFFVQRLGLHRYPIIPADYINGKKNASSLKQGDLFSGLKKSFANETKKIHCHCVPQAATAEQVLALIKNKQAFPAAVLFSSQVAVKEFYENYYPDLKKMASVLSQSGSGGGNKIFRNFSINPHSLLLATDKLVLKHLTSPSAVEQVLNLPVKTLIICRLPFEQFTHPYQEAVSQSLPNAFMDYALPKALYNFHSLVSFFKSPHLEQVYVLDSKLSKDYAAVFKNYFSSSQEYELT